MEFKVVNYNQYKNNTNSIWVGAGNKLVYGVHPCTKDTLLSNVKYALEIGYDEVCMGHYLDMDYIKDFYTKLSKEELSKIIYRISSSNLERDIDILNKLKEKNITFNKVYISNIGENINMDISRLNWLYDLDIKNVSYANCFNSYLKEIEETRKKQERLDYLISFTVQYIDNALSSSFYEGRELYVWGLNQYREDKKKDIDKAKDSIISSYKKLKKITGENINIILGSNSTSRIKENLELFNKYFKK